MPGETKHGTPTPPGQNPAGRGPQVECTEFEALLSDAIDSAIDGSGQLSPARQENFEVHRRACEVCGPLFAEVQAGRDWLRSLEPVEPPVHLVHNILIATSGVVSTRVQAATRDGRTTPFRERLREGWDAIFAPVTALVRQPRFAMSFGMIFFSFSMVLSLAGVKASDVAKIDLRPMALRHAYNDAEIKVVKYYDNIRFVYEIESKLRELKRANTPAEPAPTGHKELKQNPKDNTSGQPPERSLPEHSLPEQRQDRNYSQEYDQPVLAALRIGAPNENPTLRKALREGWGTLDGIDAPPAVMESTHRRFV